MVKSFAGRLSLTFFVCSTLVLSVLFTVFFMRALALRDVSFKKIMGNFIEVSARLIPGEEVLAVPLTEGCEERLETQALIRKLQSIREVNKNIFDLYLMVPDKDPSFLRFVTNADRDRTPVGCGERYPVADDPAVVRGFRETTVSLEARADKWGTWVSAYAPVRTVSGEAVAMLGLDVARDTLVHLQRTFLSRFLLAIAISLLFSLGLGSLSSYWLTLPVRRVIKGMEIVAGGDLDHKLERFSQTEFDRMAGIFNQMTESLKRVILEREASARERERMRRELEIATEIQRSIFPLHPPRVEGLEIEAKSVSAKEVGGDYFDFLPAVGNDRTGIIIADAAGKGIPGTLYMTRSRSVFKVISSQEKEPGATLSRSNDHIAADASSQSGRFITALYLLYDQKNRRLTYSNAGHYHPLWYRGAEKGFGAFKVSGAPVGIVAPQDYAQETVQLASNDVLVLYTDGVIEARSEGGEMFGVERLAKLMVANSALSAHDLFAKIESSLRDFIGQAPPFDDMTFIVIRVL